MEENRDDRHTHEQRAESEVIFQFDTPDSLCLRVYEHNTCRCESVVSIDHHLDVFSTAGVLTTSSRTSLFILHRSLIDPLTNCC